MRLRVKYKINVGKTFKKKIEVREAFLINIDAGGFGVDSVAYLINDLGKIFRGSR